jgi:hypothetical protein
LKRHLIIRPALMLAVGAAAAAAVAAFGAGPAAADDDSYIHSLALMGHPARSQAERDADIKLGHSLCDYLGDGHSTLDAVMLLEKDPTWTSQESADYVVVATHELCPEYAD